MTIFITCVLNQCPQLSLVQQLQEQYAAKQLYLFLPISNIMFEIISNEGTYIYMACGLNNTLTNHSRCLEPTREKVVPNSLHSKTYSLQHG